MPVVVSGIVLVSHQTFGLGVVVAFGIYVQCVVLWNYYQVEFWGAPRKYIHIYGDPFMMSYAAGHPGLLYNRGWR